MAKNICDLCAVALLAPLFMASIAVGKVVRFVEQLKRRFTQSIRENEHHE